MEHQQAYIISFTGSINLSLNVPGSILQALNTWSALFHNFIINILKQ